MVAGIAFAVSTVVCVNLWDLNADIALSFWLDEMFIGTIAKESKELGMVKNFFLDFINLLCVTIFNKDRIDAIHFFDHIILQVLYILIDVKFGINNHIW